MQENMIDVSIIVPCYNRRNLVGRAILSICRQRDINYEIVIVDDASSDGTWEALQSAQAENPNIALRLHRMPFNMSQACARNAGIALARGEFIAFLDSDDLYADPTALASLVREARQRNLDVVLAPFLLCQDGRSLRRVDIPGSRPQVGNVRSWPQLGRVHSFWQGVYRAEFLARMHVHFDERIRHREDRPFLIAALLAAERIGATDIPLSQYNSAAPGAVTGFKDRFNFGHYIRHVQSINETIAEARRAGRSDTLFELINARMMFSYLAGYWAPLVVDLAKSSSSEDQALLRDYTASMAQIAVGLPRFWELTIDAEEDEVLEEGKLDMIRLCIEVSRPDNIEYVIRGAGLSVARAMEMAMISPAAEAVVARYLSYVRRAISPAHGEQGSPTLADIRVFVHAGTTKTGSSALQNTLERNRLGLLKQGFHYPVVGAMRERGRRRRRTPGHVSLFSMLRSPSGRDAVLAALAGEVAELRGSGFEVHTLILSSEDLTSPLFWEGGSGFARLSDALGLPQDIFLVRRSPGAWLESLFVNRSENVLGEPPGDFLELVQSFNVEGLLDEKTIKDRIVAAPNVCRLHVGSYEKNVAAGGILEWFFREASIDASCFAPVGSEYINKSTSLYHAALCRALKVAVGISEQARTAAYDFVLGLPDHPNFRDWGGLSEGHALLRSLGFAEAGDTRPPHDPEGGRFFADDIVRSMSVASSFALHASKIRSPSAPVVLSKPSAVSDAIGISLLAPDVTLVSCRTPSGRGRKSLWILGSGRQKLTTFWWSGEMLAALDQNQLRSLKLADGQECRLLFLDPDGAASARANIWCSDGWHHLYPAGAQPPSADLDNVIASELFDLGPAAIAALTDEGLDRDYYLSANPDVAASGMDPAAHYRQYGWREGRNPARDFLTLVHLAEHPELARLGINPLAYHVYSARHSAASAKSSQPNAQRGVSQADNGV